MTGTGFTAGADDAGERLDQALARRGLAPSRAAAQRLADGGRVTVDGRPRQKAHRLAAGERVEVAVGEPEPEAPPAGFGVAYEDEHLIVVEKPAGVVVHPGAGVASGTLAQALAGRAAGGPDPARAGIVHRLDRDTSGLLVVAKTEDTYAELSRMVRGRELRRDYLALVEGRPESRSGTIDAPIGRDRAHRDRVSTRSDRPRDARTHFALAEAFARTSLLNVRLETGRTHQIRAHLAEIGLPVVGDRRYGGAESGRRLRLDRQFLHASGLMFSHPVSRKQIACESKPPADLRRALDAARREPVSGGPDGD